jgi:biotin synthase
METGTGAWFGRLAGEVLAGRTVKRDEAAAILRSSDDALLGLLDGAFRLRRARFGRGVMLQVIRSARSGNCTEDCAYCSQSAGAEADVPRYAMQSVEELVSGAREARRSGAVRYCVVTAGREVSRRELSIVCEAARRIKAELPLSICASLGALDDERAAALEAAGVDRYNHNLETSERHFPAICRTHTFGDRVATARRAKAAGMELCSGALLGMGETIDDRVELAFSLLDLGADAIPVNFLDPRPGTALAGLRRMPPAEALRALAMFRFVHPAAELRVAGGRERVLGPMQALALYPANSIFTRGYLTTDGQGLAADLALLEAAGFEPAGLAE